MSFRTLALLIDVEAAKAMDAVMPLPKIAKSKDVKPEPLHPAAAEAKPK